MNVKTLTNLSNVWNALAPARDKDFVPALIRDMQADGCRDKTEQCRAIIGRLYDGLAYGNWPSAVQRGDKS